MNVDPVIREQIKRDYISDKGSIKELSDKYQVSQAAIQAYSAKHGWRLTRDKLKGKTENMEVAVSQKGLELASQKVADRISSHLEAMIEGSFALRKSLLDNMMNKCALPVIVDHASHAQAVNSLVKIDDMARKSLGLNDVQELKVSGSVEHTMSILQSCQKLKESGESPVVDVDALLIEAKGCDK